VSTVCPLHQFANIVALISLDRLAVTGIVVPKINTLAIDKLVMKTESSKATIKAICQGYTSGDAHDRPFFADLIQGKGEGQIILLHGPPGTGKTLTAGNVSLFHSRHSSHQRSRIRCGIHEASTSQYYCR
jgi:Cdc6-like AAA superfamily ATPase